MKSLADGLPPDVARRIHPDWRTNETAYWAVRDTLLPKYTGRWVAFADGAVIAAGTSPIAVLEAAQKTGRHPFVVCVGREDEPSRMRRSSFGLSESKRPGGPKCSSPDRQVGGPRSTRIVSEAQWAGTEPRPMYRSAGPCECSRDRSSPRSYDRGYFLPALRT